MCVLFLVCSLPCFLITGGSWNNVLEKSNSEESKDIDVLFRHSVRALWWDEEIFGELVQKILGKLNNNSRCYFGMED